MSSSHFSRTNRNTPQRNMNKSQQQTQASITPSQNTSVAVQQQNKGGYVYRPPTRIARTNVNTIKEPIVQQKVELKKEELSKVTQVNKIEQPVKPVSFVRKPAAEIVKQTSVKTTTVVTEVTQIKEQVKPIVKPVSRLTANKTNDPLALLGLAPPPKKQEPSKIQQPPKPATLPYKTYQQKKPVLEIKPEIKPVANLGIKNPLQQLTHDSTNTKSLPALDLKKPVPYSYPKKISKRQPQPQVQQQKQQIFKNIEQTRQQTPKFSKQPAQEVAKSQQTAPYSYKKNVSQINTTQSAVNLKQTAYQNNIQTPIQKVPPVKQSPVSTILQSPAKSPLSHASRYSNKIETPTKQQKQNKEQQVVKAPIRRSPIIGFALHRLYTQKISVYYQQLINFSNKLKQTKFNEKLHQHFQKLLTKFTKNYERNFLARTSFSLIKSIYGKNVKNDMTKSTDPKLTNQLVANRNQCIGKILQNIIPSDFMGLKLGFLKLKSQLTQKRIRHIKIQCGSKILGNIESKHLKNYWQSLNQWINVKNQIKLWKINRLSEINNHFKRWLLKQSFVKLSLNKLKELTIQLKQTQTLSKNVSKSVVKAPETVTETQQIQGNKELKQKVSDLQAKIASAQQKSSEVPKQSDLRQTLKQLKQQKQQATGQISAKKQKNAQLKQKLQSLMSKGYGNQQQISSLSDVKPQNYEPTLSLIHQIYMKTYKQSQQQCISQENIEGLYSIHRVEENKLMREIVAKWLALQQNLSLKHWINLYEGNYVTDSSGQLILNNRKQAYKQLQEQNEIIKKFIRSYIKERYMWQQVKQYVAAVISE